MSKLPRSIFKARRHRRPWLAPVLEAVAKHQAMFKPGSVTQLLTWHVARCPYPRGRGECSCRPDEISIEGVS
ncbi:MAG: hypothetical protein ACLQU5_25035 [Isosphaeraceae bacterium]